MIWQTKALVAVWCVGAVVFSLWLRCRDERARELASALSIEFFLYRVGGFPTATVNAIGGRSISSGTDSNFSVVLLGPDAGALDKRVGLWANLAAGGAWTNLAISAGPLPADQWTHVVFTYDAAGGGRVYFNGSQAGPTLAYAGAVTIAPGDLSLVGAATVIDEHHQPQVGDDEIAAWQEILDQARSKPPRTGR